MKKIISILLAAVILILPFVSSFEGLVINTEASSINFKCGDNATWSLDGKGVLTISGTGEMYDLRSAMFDQIPWYDFRYSIKSVIIEEGITNIPNGAFSSCYNAESIHIASTVEVIEYDSFGFSGEKHFKTITIGENSKLRQVDSYALHDTIWYDNLPEGQPIYIGRLLYGFKGFPEDGCTIEVKEGTYAINTKAFYNRSQISEVILPDSIEYVGSYAFYDTTWLKSFPEGPVYSGSVFLGYSGDVPLSEADFKIRNGTKCIANLALAKCDRILSLTIPTSVKTIGYGAFSECINLEEVIFLSDSLLTDIGGSAFYKSSKLTAFDIPDNTEKIGDYAFNSTKISELNLSENVKSVGIKFISGASDIKLTLDENNPYLYMDKHCVIYNENKTELLFALLTALPKEYTVNSGCKLIRRYTFDSSTIEKINLNDGLEYIDDYAFDDSGLQSVEIPDTVKGIGLSAFSSCELKSLKIGNSIKKIPSFAFSSNTLLKDVVIPDSVTEISSTAFRGCKDLEKIVIPASVTSCGNAFEYCPNVTIYCYKDSSAHTCAVNNSIPYVLLDGTINNTELAKAISNAQSIDRTLYTDESLVKLDTAINAVKLDAEGLTQEQVDLWCDALNAAMNGLEYKPADFSAVETAKSQAETIDRTLYTSESLTILDKALAAVDYNLTIDKQAQVTEWAKMIENAIKNLDYLPADYSAVNSEISKAEKIDRRCYSELSLIALDTAINSVDYSLNITEQEKVDAFAESISDAISALQYASIVLRHEPCGVIVSATTKEIKPDTVLAVEEVDPTNYEGTNFAVGGSIRSLHFYDINLVYEAVIVQPGGTVTVKIKLADGVDPAKCKVYHVTEDIVNPLVRYASTIDGNYIVFEADHFSEFAVIEVETVLDSVEVLSMPAKAEYGIGESLDLTGLKVVANYSDGTSKEISDYNVGMVSLNSVGTKKVTVYYTFGSITKTAEFEINVSAKKCSADITENGKSVNSVNKKIGLFSLYSKASILLDCNIKNADGCNVRWSSDNSKVFVDKNGKVTCKGFFGAKKANITVEVIDSDGNVVTKDTVSVVFYKLAFQLSGSDSQTFNLLRRRIILW